MARDELLRWIGILEDTTKLPELSAKFDPAWERMQDPNYCSANPKDAKLALEMGESAIKARDIAARLRIRGQEGAREMMASSAQRRMAMFFTHEARVREAYNNRETPVQDI